MNNDNVFESISYLLMQVPEMLALLAGVIVALCYMRKYPRPSVCLLLGCVILLLMIVLTEFFFFYGMDAFLDDLGAGLPPDHFVMLIRSVLSMGAHILIIVGVYIARRGSMPPRLPRGEDNRSLD